MTSSTQSGLKAAASLLLVALALPTNAATVPTSNVPTSNVTTSNVTTSNASTNAAEATRNIESSSIGTLHLTLGEVLERARSRPLAEAADQRTLAAEQSAEGIRRQNIWPTVQIDAGLARRDRDFEFETPLGAFNLGERTSSSATLTVAQPLFDPASRFHALPAARLDAEASAFEAERLRQNLESEAADRFLDVVATDAQLRATEAFMESLEERLRETEERVKAGRLLGADALKVKLDLESAILDRTNLLLQREVLLQDVGRAIGHGGAIEPDFAGPYDHDISLEELVGAGRLIDEALARRPDLLARDAARKAVTKRAAAERASLLPKLQAGVSYATADGDPFRPDELLEGSLFVRWTPFQAKTRKLRTGVLEARAEALDQELEEARRALAIEVRFALARLQQSRAAVVVRQTGIELASETLRVERERYQNGRATTNDLLDAEATLRQQRTAHALARIEVLRAWISLGLAVGDLSILPASVTAPEHASRGNAS